MFRLAFAVVMACALIWLVTTIATATQGTSATKALLLVGSGAVLYAAAKFPRGPH